MPRHCPYRIDLREEERTVLESIARSYTLPYWQVVRAQMVLLAADGLRNARSRSVCAAAARSSPSGVSGSSSSASRASRIGPGAADRRLFPPPVRAEVIRLACERPAD